MKASFQQILVLLLQALALACTDLSVKVNNPLPPQLKVATPGLDSNQKLNLTLVNGSEKGSWNVFGLAVDALPEGLDAVELTRSDMVLSNVASTELSRELRQQARQLGKISGSDVIAFDENLDTSNYYIFFTGSQTGRANAVILKVALNSVGAIRTENQGDNLVLNWDAVPEALAYEIQDLSDTTEAPVVSDSPNFTIKNYDDSREYTYCVRSVAGKLRGKDCSRFSREKQRDRTQISRISSTTQAGHYRNGDTISIVIHYAEAVQVQGLPVVKLNNGGSASYVSGSGTDSLVFQYTVASGQDVARLEAEEIDVDSASAILEKTGQEAASKTLPKAGSPTSLSADEVIVIDNTVPTAPSALSFGIATTTSAVLNLQFQDGSDSNLKEHEVKLCETNNCQSNCGSVSTASASPATLLGAANKSYFGCARALDKAGNGSDWVASTASIRVDPDAVYINNISSSTPNGFYKVGDNIVFIVVFSEAVTVTNPSDVKLQINAGSTPRYAIYVSGSGTAELTFIYTILSGDAASDLDISGLGALILGNTGQIIPLSGLPLATNLPTVGGNNSISGQNAIVLDTTAPTAPANIGSANPLSASTNVTISWTPSTDANLDKYQSKFCTNADCTTGCLAVVETSNASSVLAGVNGGSYYSCVRSIDKAGNSTAWVPSLSTVTIDANPPTISNVTSTSNDGNYKTGDTISLSVQFNENIFVTGSPNFKLETGTTDRDAVYSSGSGTNTLLFTYTVQTADSSSDLEAQSANGLTLSSGVAIKDAAGGNAVLTLPTLGGGNSISGQKAILVDGTAPLAPSNVAFASAYSTTATVPVSWTNASDANFLRHNLKLCGANDCNTGCVGATTATSTPANITGSNGGVYYACVQGEDNAGNTSAWIASPTTLRVDTTAPSVTNVTSGGSNAWYNAGDVLAFSVTFSEVVSVSNPGDLRLDLETGNPGVHASYTGGTGTNTLSFAYTIVSGDNSADLEVSSLNALVLGASGLIKDAAGNDANLSLPALGGGQSLGGQKAIAIDTVLPVAPASSSFSSATSTTTAVSVNFVAGTDSNLRYHNSKLCTNINCSTGCLTAETASGSPKSLTGSDGASYYACVQAEDHAGNVSAWTVSAAAIAIDATAPTVTNVSSSSTNGHFNAGDTVTISVQFSESVAVTNSGSLSLLLETGSSDHSANYASGTGSNTLIFSYVVQAGDASPDLDVASTSALSLGANGTIRDASGNNANLSLPALGSGISIAGQKDLILDGTNPSDPVGPSFASALSTSTNVSLGWTPSSDTNFRYHNSKICTANDCSTGCLSIVTAVNSPSVLTGVNGGVYYGCVQGEDLAGNTSAWISSLSPVTIDSTAPSVSNVSSALANGNFKINDSVTIQLQFSESVFVSNGAALGLSVNVGASRTATYTSGSGTNTLVFTYLVQSSDASSDLELSSVNALTVGAGSIRDGAGNDANLGLPALGGGSSLSGQKTLLIDGVLPTVPAAVTVAASSPTTSLPISWTAGSDSHFKQHNVKLCTNNSCTAGCTAAIAEAGTSTNVTGINNTAYYGCVQAEDNAGNLSAWVASPGTVTINQVDATINSVTISQADGIYKLNDVLTIQVTFSKAVDVTNPGDLSILLETGSTDNSATYASGSGSAALVFTYTVQAGDNTEDLDVHSAAAFDLGATGAIKDTIAVQNANLTLPAAGAATSISGQKAIVLDNTAPGNPSSVGFTLAATNNTNLSLAWVTSSDLHFKHHNVKICTSNDCNTGCIGLTTEAGTAKTIAGVAGNSYYACVQGEDHSAYTSAWVPSLQPIVVDSTASTVSNVSSTSADGLYKATDSITISVLFNETVYVTNGGDLRLTLETGSTDRQATYLSGSASNTLLFSYTVQGGDNSGDLDAESPTALVKGAAGMIRDAAGNDATLTLPTLGGGSSIAGQKAIVVDGVAPTISLVGSNTAGTHLNAGDTIDVYVTASENITVANDASLGIQLSLGSPRLATYHSGSGSTNLVFRYSIQSGDTSSDLDYTSNSALGLGSAGSLKDAAGNNLVLTLPNPGTANALAANSAIIVDTTAPASPTAISFSLAQSGTNPSIIFTAGSDSYPADTSVKACQNTGCSSSCTAEVNPATSPQQVASATAGATYYACVNTFDLAGNSSGWVSGGSTTIVNPPLNVAAASAEVKGSNANGTAKVEITLSGVPSGAISGYNIYFHTTNVPGNFNFSSPVATINYGDATYDASTADDKIIAPVPVTSLYDGYYVVRFISSGGIYTDTNTTVSSLTHVLKGQAGYALVPKAYTALSYDYYMMRYEASLSATGTNAGGDAITSSETNKKICEFKFHMNGTVNDASCGTRVITKKAESVAGVTPASSLSQHAAYFACRNASDANALIRLPNFEEWTRASQWFGSTYASMKSAYDGGGSNCNMNTGTVANTGSAANCKNGLNIHDMSGNAIEFLEDRTLDYDAVASGTSRFSYQTSMQRLAVSGIDNRSRFYQYNMGTTGAMRGVLIGSSYHSNYETWGPNFFGATQGGGAGYGFRCMGFRADSVPTVTQLSLPDEPKYMASDYSGAASTWTIPENKMIGDVRTEDLTITVNGNTSDNVAEGQVTMTWKPWTKSVCNVAGSCTESDIPTYKLFRFIEPNFLAIRPSPNWVIGGAGSVYSSDKPYTPLAVDANGNRLFDASTNDGKLIATVSNCNSGTPANCSFTDSTSAGTGFSTMKIYNYILVAVDASGNEVVASSDRNRSRYISGAGWDFRMSEPRFRRAAVFLVDEAYQQSLSVPQVMAHVPMNKSGHDSDFFIHKYESQSASGTVSNNATTATWPLQYNGSISVTKAGECHEKFLRTQTFDLTACGNGSSVNATTTILKSVSGGTPLSNIDQGAAWKACRNTGVADEDGKVYYMKLITNAEFFKAADWGSLDLDGTIEAGANGNTGGVTSIATLEYTAPADTTTVRCHLDVSPGSAYAAGSSQTARCRSRYNVADLIGNLSEITADQAANNYLLDNGIDGQRYLNHLICLNSESIATLGRFDFVIGLPFYAGTTRGWTAPFWSNDVCSSASGHNGIWRGGNYSTLDGGGRYTTHSISIVGSGTGSPRCSL